MPKFVFIAGGVMSGVGKGAACAAIGRIIQDHGYRVTAMKVDPYINVDAGTMNPVEHGEVFVTDDGDETDQDIGNYERFLGQSLGSVNYMTTGRVYQTVIQRERNLEYGGKTVEVVPHVPEEIIRRIMACQRVNKADVVMIEIGGTVGEYQNILFLEAARMMKMRNPKDVQIIMVSYLPIPGHTGEMKTKPTQNAVRTINSAGLQVDFILCRASRPIDEPRKRKISVFCNVGEDQVISAPDVRSIYEIPVNFEKENLGIKILKRFGLRSRKGGGNGRETWASFVRSIDNRGKPVRIGIVGKYFGSGDFTLSDTYLSVIEAVKHAAWSLSRQPSIDWVYADGFERDPKSIGELDRFDGIIVPGGFGSRGAEGKIMAIRWCRENRKPFLGICYGMQLATVEFARNVVGLKGANTTEIDGKTPHPVIHIMPEQESLVRQRKYGATMRLGAWPCRLAGKTASRRAYARQVDAQGGVSERHRHRYEFNNAYREQLRQAGLVIAGTSPDGLLVEVVEIKDHPFFVATQYHPELKSRPLDPHPLFTEFIRIAGGKKGRK
ncbi:CTP synthase [Candidatus Uhrbacteria bacterium]|nr:CTP synthase [Candidatus Uhrbacteria bacterium]